MHSARLDYVLDHMSNRYPIEWYRTNNSKDAEWIYATSHRSEAMYTPYRCPIMREGYHDNIETSINLQDDIPHLHLGYPFNEGFDMIAAIFYMLSRYEEYQDHIPDQHGRYIAQSSISFQYDLLQQPIVDIWLSQWIDKWNTTYPSKPIQSDTKYQWQPTIDIDLPYAYSHKGWRSYAGLIKDLVYGDITNLKNRWSVLSGKKPDPYNNFENLLNVHNLHQVKPICFILMGDYGGYDKSLGKSNKHFCQLIQDLSKHYKIGLHPSYASNDNLQLLIKEKTALEQIIGNEIEISRQHFLKIHFPNTYRQLIDVGITDDYSMGYSTQVGFRAGTSSPFLWYDLDREEQTGLTIHSFQLMDVTIHTHLNMSIDEAIQCSQKISNQIKAVNGSYITIWHNSSYEIHGWQEWNDAYQRITLNTQK